MCAQTIGFHRVRARPFEPRQTGFFPGPSSASGRQCSRAATVRVRPPLRLLVPREGHRDSSSRWLANWPRRVSSRAPRRRPGGRQHLFVSPRRPNGAVGRRPSLEYKLPARYSSRLGHRVSGLLASGWRRSNRLDCNRGGQRSAQEGRQFLPLLCMHGLAARALVAPRECGQVHASTEAADRWVESIPVVLATISPLEIDFLNFICLLSLKGSLFFFAPGQRAGELLARAERSSRRGQAAGVAGTGAAREWAPH